MGEIATLVVAFTLTAVLLCACCTAAAVHMLRVRNRVAPGVKTRAPLSWLWSPRAAARLHRRLRRSVLGARMSLEATSSFAELALEVERRAVVLDRELVAADRARRVGELRDEVEEVEALNQRLVAMARNRRTDLAGVHERLDALDAALRELELPNSA
jgi:hypothetical protein